MSWAGIASNQTVTFNNLQDAVNTGVFTAKTSIPASNECITKTDANTYVNINTSNAGYSSKTSNQLVYKADLTAASSGVTFVTSSGLYPVSGASNSCSGFLYNYNAYTVLIWGVFNSAGINSGYVGSDNVYFNFPFDPSIPTERLFFNNPVLITSYGQSIYTDRNSDGIRAGWFLLPSNTYANITIDKFDGLGSGSTFRLAYSTQVANPKIII